MPRGFRGESVAQEARGGSRAAVERGRAAASRSFQTAPMEDSSRFEQANPNRDERGSYNPGDIAREALTYDQFMTATGRSETNPYGDQGFFSRVLGIDPSNINYVASTPGGIATLNQVNALAYDQYMNPRDAQGNIRGMLREGSPTRSGTVVYDPTMETDLGIMGAIPIVGPLLQNATSRSALNISSYDNPLFSDMSDMGNELGAFPAPPLGSPASAESSIPTAMELRSDRIDRLVAELEEATADSPDASSLARREYRPSVVSSLPDYPEFLDFEVGRTATTFNEPINPPIRTELNVTRTGAVPDMASISPLPEPSLPNLPSLDPLTQFQYDLGTEYLRSAGAGITGENIDQMLAAQKAANQGAQIREDVRTFGARSASAPPPPPLDPMFTTDTPIETIPEFLLAGRR